MKVHRNVSVVEVGDPVLLTELTAATSLADFVVRRLSETVVVVDSTRLPELLEELVRRGYAHRVLDA